nr:molecular chaperone DnaJ [Rhizobium sp. Khangiran2]
MLLGQSLFQSVLTRLDEEGKQDEDGTDQPAFQAGLKTAFVAATTEADTDSEATGHAARDAYLDLLADIPEPEAEPRGEEETEQPDEEPTPPHLLRLAESEIAEELAVSQTDTVETLAEKRRRFAKDNHPDRVPEALRDHATLRMKTANLLIDRAIKDLYWRSS